MEIKTIKIEVPNDYTVIKDFEIACRVLGIKSIIPAEIAADKQLCAIYKMQIVLKAVNLGHTFNLISGEVWYPYVRFIGKSDVDSRIYSEESRILDFNYENRIFTLVGGYTDIGVRAGLGSFFSDCSVGYSGTAVSFFACHDEQRAHHVSKYFAALIFDCCFTRELGFSLSNGDMVTKNYSIND